jgi:hypothetical protein
MTSLAKMAIGDDGAVVAVGNYTGSLILPQSSLSSFGASDAFLLKIDPANGAFLWGRKHGGVNDDGFNDVANSGCGDVFVAGFYRSIGTDFGGGSLPFSGSASSIGNGVLAKYRP